MYEYKSLDQWLRAELHGFAPVPTQKEPAGRVLNAIRNIAAKRAARPTKADKAKAAAALEQIHALAKGLLARWTWHDEVRLPLEGCVALRANQADRATELHDDISDFVIESIKGCGGLPPEFVGLLEAIKDFVYPLGWDYSEGWTGPDA